MQKIPGYQIIRKIDQGGMSTVYLAVQLSVGREVALKVMSPALNSDPIFSERFQREANIVGQLTHPSIVRIYDIGRHNNLNYIAMDYLPGGTIHDKMSSGISLNEALRITREIAGALDHAHRKGYVHRDIKPENILFNEDNAAILSDFGVAKTVSSGSQMTNAGTVVGTPHYMSPEQARGKPIDGRSDLYSLGVVFYEMLTGSVPFKADEAVAIAIKHLTAPIPKLPSQYVLFQPLVNKLLAKEAEDRFQCGREIIDSIENTQNQLSGHPTSYTTSTESPTVQIFVLLKVLLLTTYAALSSNLWRLLKLPGKSLGRNNRDTTQQRENYTTVIATRTNDAVVVTRNPRTKKKLPILTLLLLLTTWLAASKWLHSGDNNLLKILPAPFHSITAVTNQGIDNLIMAIWPNEHKPQAPLRANHAAASGLAHSNASVIIGEDVKANPNEVTPPTETTSIETGAPDQSGAMERIKAASSKPIPTEFALTVDTRPNSARVRIMNIRDTYQPGMKLSPGSYDIQVSAKGYHTLERTIEIDNKDQVLKLSLTKAPIAGTVFYNKLKTGGKGPAMVIIPPGRFDMGHRSNSDTAPVRNVRIRRAFGASQYEITYADYLKFTTATNTKFPKSRWGKGSRPVTNISWHDALAYTQWLREASGKKYRLLTEAEWEYASRSGSSSDYWWGNTSAQGRANCRRGCDSPYSSLLSIKTAPVGSFKANAFKLFDTAGNVAEWVQDCYQDHYLAAPKDGSAIDNSRCSNRAIRGGSIRSNSSALKSYSRDSQPPASKASHIGFRVAVDLY